MEDDYNFSDNRSLGVRSIKSLASHMKRKTGGTVTLTNAAPSDFKPGHEYRGRDAMTIIEGEVLTQFER